MYHQVLIPDDQQTFLEFLWWRTDDINDEPQDFMMCAHVFGGASLASLSNIESYRQQRSVWSRCSNYAVEKLLRAKSSKVNEGCAISKTACTEYDQHV